MNDKAPIPAEAASEPVKQQLLSQAMQIQAFGYEINLLSVMIILLIFGLLFLFWRIQTTKKLDFADMITKDGRTVSLTKVLQLIGGLTATWVLIKLTLTNNLSEGILAIYLAYVASIEGYSKFISAKYKYNEASVNDPGRPYEYDRYEGRYESYGARPNRPDLSYTNYSSPVPSTEGFDEELYPERKQPRNKD